MFIAMLPPDKYSILYESMIQIEEINFFPGLEKLTFGGVQNTPSENTNRKSGVNKFYWNIEILEINGITSSF